MTISLIPIIEVRIGSRDYLPPKLLRAKLLAASELAAYTGYASTRKVKMPLKTRTVLRVPSGQLSDFHFVRL